jgi:hypothetical protein
MGKSLRPLFNGTTDKIYGPNDIVADEMFNNSAVYMGGVWNTSGLDLTAREARIVESEPFLPLARQLQEMKLALDDALPWIETINEVAQIQNMDIKSAGVLVAQEYTI